MIVFYSLVAFFAQKVVPYLGFFPYKELLVEYGLPSWVSSFANFDGIHYLLIAKQNYSQWEQAFFPLYPLLIKTIELLIPNHLVSALFISNVCFIVGLTYFKKLMKMWEINTSWPLFVLLSFPTAFYFGAVYTEGLFFMLFVLSLYFLQRENYPFAGLFAALSSATRLIGIFLIIPFFFHFLSLHKGKLRDFRLSTFDFMTLASPLLGLLCYMFYLWITTGDPIFFFNSQPIFGANRSTHLIFLPQVYFRYFKILFTATRDFQWYLSLFEMSIFTLVFMVLILDLVGLLSFRSALGGEKSSERSERKNSAPARFLSRFMLLRNNTQTMSQVGLSIFSFVNLLLPTLTGTFSSIPRYALFSLSFFLYIGQTKSQVIKVVVIGIFSIMQVVLLSLFVQGYFVG